VFERTPWTQTAGDFYHFIGNLLMPVEEIVVDLNKRVVDVTHGAGRDLQRVGGRR
jgi:hypothetical protein